MGFLVTCFLSVLCPICVHILVMLTWLSCTFAFLIRLIQSDIHPVVGENVSMWYKNAFMCVYICVFVCNEWNNLDCFSRLFTTMLYKCLQLSWQSPGGMDQENPQSWNRGPTILYITFTHRNKHWWIREKQV